MADTLDITAGTGTTIATDDVGGTHYQEIKLVNGTKDSATPVAVDVGVKANALRVAPANDITDGTYIGDIKFGEALPAGTAGIGKLTANSGVDIGDVDVTSVVPGVAATNLGKAEDAAHASGDVGVAAMTVRANTATSLSGADNDYQPLITDTNGCLHTTDANITACNTGAVVLSSGTVTTVSTVSAVTSLDKSVYVDDADWTDNTSSHTLVGGIYQSAPHTVTDGDVSPFQLDVNGKIIESNSTAIATSLAVLDDWDDANYCNVNLNLAGTDAGVGESALDGTELRVTLATDDDGVAHLSTIAGAVAATHMQCDILEGTVTTVSTVTNLAQMGGTAITMDEGAHDAGTQRVTLATDDDGVAHLATIAGDTTSIDGAVYVDDADWTDNTSKHILVGGVYQSAPHTVTDGDVSPFQLDVNGKLIESNSAAIAASLAIVDGWDATHDGAAPADGPQLMAAYDATKPTAVADGDAVRVLADEYGRLLSGVEKTAWQEDYDSADASGEGEAVKASAASTIVVVQSYVISVDAEMWVKLQEEDSTALTGKFWLKAGGGVAITLPDKAPLILGVDSDLEVITEGAGNISVSATGYTIPG